MTDLRKATPEELLAEVRAELKPVYHVTPGGLWWSRSTDALREIAARLKEGAVANRGPSNDHPRDGVYLELEAERLRQDKRWGEQNHPDGTGDCMFVAEAAYRRDRCESAFSADSGTWKDILLEEVWEAMAESDPAALRAELVQVAAVSLAWVEAIDRRKT